MATRGKTAVKDKEKEKGAEDTQICKMLAEMKQELMKAIQMGTAKLDARIDRVDLKLEGIQQAVDGLKSAQKTTDARLRKLEDHEEELLFRVQYLERMVQTQTDKLDDLEGRERRCNIRVVGYPETPQVRDMAPVMQTFLPKLFGADNLSPFFVVERAHRTTPTPPRPGAPPRPILVKLLNFRDRDAILQMSRERGTLRHEGAAISVYPDYALNVQNARRAFDACKKVLRKHDVKYAVLFPARLRLVWKEKAHFFNNVEGAVDFIAENIGDFPEEDLPRARGGRRNRRRSRPPKDGKDGKKGGTPPSRSKSPPAAGGAAAKTPSGSATPDSMSLLAGLSPNCGLP